MEWPRRVRTEERLRSGERPDNRRRMLYRESLSISWALTWRLVLAEIVLAALILMFLFAFGSPARLASPQWFALAYGALGWLLLWPFVLRRGLPPQLFGFDAKHARLQYWPAVTFGLLADLASLIPVLAIALLMRAIGMPVNGAGIMLLVVVTRCVVVLPGAIGLMGRRTAS